MIKKNFKKVMSVLLCVLIIATTLPISSLAATPKAATAVADNGTAYTFESIMGTDIDGNRYAGRVWVDKSVYTDGQTAVLNTSGDAGSTFKVNLEQGESFQTVFSALGSSMTTTETTNSTGPMDVILVLDNSVSMNETPDGRTTRMEKVITSANNLLENLLDGKDVRLGIVAYAQNASTVLPFGEYTDGVVLKVNSYTGSGSRNGIITAYKGSNPNQAINSSYKSSGYANYTNV